MPEVFAIESRVTSAGVEEAMKDIDAVGKAWHELAGASEAAESTAVGAASTMSGAMRESASASAEATKASDGHSRALDALGKGAQIASGAIVLGMAAGARSSLELETTLTRIPALVGDVGMSVDDMSESVRGISSATGQGPTELAEALFSITSAGFQGEEALDILNRSAMAAAAGLGQTGDVAFAAGSVVNAYGGEMYDAAGAIDIMVGTVKAGNLSAADLAGSLGAILPIASAAGVKLEDLGGAVALITRSGATAGEAVTQMKAAIQAMNAPGTAAQKMLADMGLSAEDLQRTLREEGLTGALRMVEDATGGNEIKMREFFGSSEALSGALTILNSDADTLAGTFGAVQDSAGLTDQAFDTTANSGAFKVDKAMNDLKVTLGQTAEAAVPLITKAAELASKLIDGFNGLPDVVKNVGMIGIVAGGTASKFGPMISSALGVGKALLGIGSAAGGAAQGAGAVAGAMGGTTKSAGGLVSKLVGGAGALNPAMLGIGVAATIAVPLIIGMMNKQDELAEATARVTEKLVGQHGAMTTTTQALSEYIDTASRFDSRNQIDDLDRLELSYGDLTAMLRDGADGMSDFIARAVEYEEIGPGIGRILQDLVDKGTPANKMWDEYETAIREATLSGGDYVTASGEVINVSGEIGDANDDLIKSFILEQEAMQNAAEEGVKTMQRFDEVTDAQVELATATNTAADGTVDWIGVQETLQGMLDGTASGADTGAEAIDGWAAAAGIAQDQAGTAADVTGDYDAALADLEGQVSDTTDEMHDMAKAFDELIGVNLSAEEAAFKYIDELGTLTKALADNGTELDTNSQKGRDNRDAVRDTIEAAFDHVQALKDQGATMDQQRSAFDRHIADLRDTMIQAGFTEDQVNDLIAEYGLVPANVDTILGTETDDASVTRWTGLLGTIPEYINTTINTQYTSTGSPSAGAPVMSKTGTKLAAFAEGGFTDWPETEGRLVILHGQETVLDAEATRAMRNGAPNIATSYGSVGSPTLLSSSMSNIASGDTIVIEQLIVNAGLGATRLDAESLGHQLIEIIQTGERSRGRTFTRDDAPTPL